MEKKIKLINKVVWWIPFKDLRNLVRDTLISINKINKIDKLEQIIIDNNSIAMSELILEKMFHGGGGIYKQI